MPGSDPITSIANLADSVLTRVLPDKAAQDAAHAHLGEMVINGTLAQAAAEMGLAQEVNQTMRAEASSAHWLQWAWRPLIGLVLAAILLNNFVLLPYFSGFGLKPIEVPDKAWEVMLAVVGVSALTRGGEKIAAVYTQLTGQAKGK